jgi:ADP-heptose:LPS heptosyltransferase
MARVLVIQLSRLGDVIQSTPLLMEWMACRPEDQIDVLVQEQNRQVLDGLSGLHRVRSIPDANAYRQIEKQLKDGFNTHQVPQSALALLKSLDLPRYATIVNLTYDLLPCWLVGQLPCDRVVGGYVNRQGERLFSGPQHVYLTSFLGCRNLNWFNLIDLWRAAAPGEHVPSGAARPHVSVADRLPFFLPEGKKAAINPGSSSSDRRWPPSYFARLAARLSAAGVVPVLVGAPSDREVCAEVVDLCSVTLRSYCGQTTVPQMARLLSETSLLVSVDTGAVHIASAVGTPVVGLYGATASFRETAPWSEGNVILQAPLGSGLAQLEPDLVFAACCYRLGLLDMPGLSRELTGQHATAWETSFLPAGSDPVGGLGYRALHRHRLAVSDVFSRALRHVFAAEFRKTDTPLALAYLGEWVGGMAILPAASDVEAELSEMRDTIASAIVVLENMAGHATEAGRLVRALTPKTSARLSSLGDMLIGALETLKTQVERPFESQLTPVVQYLDWSFRMMPLLSPVETFRYHQRKYVWAVAALRRAAAATTEFFDTRETRQTGFHVS